MSTKVRSKTVIQQQPGVKGADGVTPDTSTYFIQGGNSFGVGAQVGSNDSYTEFLAFGVAQMRVTDTYIKSNVALGVGTVPNALLHIAGGVGTALFGNVSDNVGGWYYAASLTAGNGFLFVENGGSTNDATKHRIEFTGGGGGQIDMTDNTGYQRIHLRAATGVNHLEVNNDAKTGGLEVQADGTTIAYQKAGIGIAIPLAQLHIKPQSNQIPVLIIGNPTGTDNWRIVNSVPATYAWLDMLEGDMTSNANYRILHQIDANGVREAYYNGAAGIRLKFSTQTTDNRIEAISNTGVSSFAVASDGKIILQNLPAGPAGLAAGTIYADTAANILANGDLIAGIKQ